VRHQIATHLAPALLLVACGGNPPADRPSESEGATEAAQEETHAAGEDQEHEDEHGEEPGRVTLSASALETAGIRIESVIAGGSGQSAELVVPGQVQFDPRRVALVSPRVEGRIERLDVVVGDRVRAGQTVAELYSAEFATAQADALQAERRARLLSGTTDSSGANALANAARRRLRLLGLSDDGAGRVLETGTPLDFLPLASPIKGTITKSHTLPGAAVEAGAPVFEVSDLDVMDVAAEVPEASLPLVRIGQRAAVGIAAYPTMSFQGEVERMSGELNPETRTVQAVVHVPNRGGHLRAGMFATVRLSVDRRTDPATPDSVVTVPASAIVTEGERHFAFVQVQPGTFERREVEVASLTPAGSMAPVQGRVAVRRGLRPGERVVTAGAFTLKSELAKASLGEHGH
jgi:RND family efflux transporter MFP subunit